MLKKIIFTLIIAVGIGFAAAHCNHTPPTVTAKVYFVDYEMMRLLPHKVEIFDSTPKKEGQQILNMLIEGDDGNETIFRTIPDIPGCMTVKVENNNAIVDIKQEMIDNHPEGRNSEVLTIYSIVKSLVSIDGITGVRFTINGKIQKNFMGYVDMRETFIFDEYV